MHKPFAVEWPAGSRVPMKGDRIEGGGVVGDAETLIVNMGGPAVLTPGGMIGLRLLPVGSQHTDGDARDREELHHSRDVEPLHEK